MIQTPGGTKNETKKILKAILIIGLIISLIPIGVLAADINDASVFLKQPYKSKTCTLYSAAMMLRRRAILEGKNDWAQITPDAMYSAAWSGGLRFNFKYAGMSITASSFTGTVAEKKSKLISMLKSHPEGIEIYTYGANVKWHAVLLTDYTNGVFYVADPAPGIANGRIPLTSAYFNGTTQDQRIGWIKQIWYITGGNCSIPAAPEPAPAQHVHSWNYKNDSGHPHEEYKICSCGTKEYTGIKITNFGCNKCFPVGNARLTRSFNSTTGDVTFYRNWVNNANEYSLQIMRSSTQNGYYSNYANVNMNSASYNTTLPQGYYYKAKLTAKNSATYQSRSSDCDSFRIYNTYSVTYNANGGSSAPASQTKIQDTVLTLSSAKPSKAHYVFKGWSKNQSASEVSYEPGSTYDKNAKITLYAVWEPETYVVSYDSNGGKGEAEQSSVTYGDTAKMPNTIVKDGYYLKGWARNKTAANAEYKIGIDYAIDENLILYAVWGNAAWSGAVSDKFAGGDGTKANPYLISNAAELAYLAKITNSRSSIPEYKYYKLTDNINLGYVDWLPIGVYNNENQYFCGSFDGNGFTISDLLISEAENGYAGLFGKIQGSEIKNVNIAGDVSGLFSETAIHAGALAGMAADSDIHDCNAMYVNVSDISAGTNESSSVACLAGNISGGKFSNNKAQDCYVFLKAGKFNAGILIGYSNTDIKDCSINSKTDELFGTDSSIGEFNFGGIAGYAARPINKCSVNAAYLSNTIKTTSAAGIGGIAGKSTASISLCSAVFKDGASRNIDGEQCSISIYATGTGNLTIGGIVGNAGDNCCVSDCKYNGQSIAGITSNGNSTVGGLIGQGNAIEDKLITIDGGIPLNREILPKKSGYTASWYTDAKHTVEYNFSEIPTSNITLYAKWKEGDDGPDIWDGTSKKPLFDEATKTYTVTCGEELKWLEENEYSNNHYKNYTIELNNDIYLNDISDFNKWKYGSSVTPANETPFLNEFYGEFNGNNHYIYGMYGYGLTNSLYGTVKNITIKNSRIMYGGFIANQMYAGSISGCIISDSAATCSNNHDLEYRCIGGIVGLASTDDQIINISNCINEAYISCSNAGGIVGQCSSGWDSTKGYISIKNCINRGSIELKHNSQEGSIGGIVGLVSYSRKNRYYCGITNCYNKGSVSGYSAGGIGGACHNTEVEACYNTGNIKSIDTIGKTGQVGGICGFFENSSATYCYNIGWVYSGQYNAGIIGSAQGRTNDNRRVYIKFCYCKDTYYFNETGLGIIVAESYASVSLSSFKSVYNFKGFSSYYANNSNYNSGYMYLKSMEESYKKYTISAVEEEKLSLNRCFANVAGAVYSNSSNKNAFSGGMIGFGNSTANGHYQGENLLTISEKISANTASGSYTAASGDMIGKNSNNKFTFSGIYSNSGMDLSAVNSAKAANTATETKGASRTLTQIKRESFLKTVFGPTVYRSLDYLNTDPTAVWVVKNGELPELYYNMLNDIKISDEIENGTITTDKPQAVNGEIVTVTAAPNADYILNKIYINGEEIQGNAFEVNGETTVYAVFSQKPRKYTAKIEATDNAAASISNADEPLQIMSLGSPDTNSNDGKSQITATEGDEIRVYATANENYNIDSVLVNGEEIAGNSFIIDSNTDIKLKVSSLSTEISVQTNEAINISDYFATISGRILSDNADNVCKYMRYWKESDPSAVYITEVENGTGEYSADIYPLESNTVYCFQMTENGPVKKFKTLEFSTVSDGPAEDDNRTEPITSTTVNKLESTYSFNITSEIPLDDERVIVAAYAADGTLVSAKVTAFGGNTKGNVKMPQNPNISYVKVFVWTKQCAPLGEAEIINSGL